MLEAVLKRIKYVKERRGCRTKVRQLRVFIQHKTPSFEKPGVCGIISLCY